MYVRRETGRRIEKSKLNCVLSGDAARVNSSKTGRAPSNTAEILGVPSIIQNCRDGTDVLRYTNLRIAISVGGHGGQVVCCVRRGFTLSEYGLAAIALAAFAA